MPKKYRTKQKIIEAVQWNGTNHKEIDKFAEFQTMFNDENVYIKTPYTLMRAEKFDYIIKNDDGEFFPCKPHIFENNYELIEHDE